MDWSEPAEQPERLTTREENQLQLQGHQHMGLDERLQSVTDQFREKTQGLKERRKAFATAAGSSSGRDERVSP